MADQSKDSKPAKAADDDKSINELLKEYADDVKDKDLDDFLKSNEDDAFEGDDTSDDDGVDQAAVPTPKKSGGLLTAMLLLIAFGAAGAGTYMYINRSEGMTSIMGGFMGGNEASKISMETPPAPQEAPVLPAPTTEASTDLPAQPSPILNEAAPTESVPLMPANESEPPAAELMPAPTTDEPATDLMAMPSTDAATPPVAEMPAESVPTPSTDLTPTPDAADAAKAVDAWAAGVADGVTDTAAKLPEQSVDEIKAKPVSAPKADNADAGPSIPKKAKAAPSGMDGALPPPYMAIQAQKGGAAMPTSAAPKMAPVVEGASSGRNENEADVTSATGDYRNMVMNGGGKIEIAGSKTSLIPAGTEMPVVSNTAPAPVATPAPAMAPRLAISGGKSLPPTSDDMGAPAMRAAPAPVAAPEMPVVETPKVEAPTPAQAPAASTSSNDAGAMLQQAMSADKAGDAAQALDLYQRALELDAVYGDGKSIDRGMVYDRIGAIRAGSK